MPLATGGIITNVGGKRIHTFNNSGTFSVQKGGTIEYLVIGGAGGGGTAFGGGGGAGAKRTGTFAATVRNYAITIGASGAGGINSGNNGINGGDSIIEDIITSLGGGGGASGANGIAGGSGGGGSVPNKTGGAGNTGGNTGGNGLTKSAGGGGGAGAVGTNALEPQLLTNYNFNGNANGWNLNPNSWIYTGNSVTHDPSQGTGALTQNPVGNGTIIVGKKYRVVIVLTIGADHTVDNTMTLRFAGNQLDNFFGDDSGTYTYDVVAADTTGIQCTLNASGFYDGIINSISVIAYTGGTGGAGSSSSISGSAVTYAKGGGGAGYFESSETNGKGGIDGIAPTVGINGGGGGGSFGTNGAAGSSGVIIFSYVPTNIPGNAIVIPSLPYTNTIDPSVFDTGDGYTATCITNQYNTIWYKYTTKSTERLISINAGIDIAGNYVPVVAIYKNDLTQYVLSGNNFCDANGKNNYWLEIPVQPNTTYYFQIVNQNNTTPLTSQLVFQVVAGSATALVNGNLVIPDHATGFPAAILGQIDGSFKNFVTLGPLGSFLDIISGGIIAIATAADTVTIYNKNQAILGTHTFIGKTILGIRSNSPDTFYVFANAGSSPLLVYTLNSAGTLGGITWSITYSEGSAPDNFAVNAAGTRLYWGCSSSTAIAHAYDLTNSVALADLHAAFTTERIIGSGDGFVASDTTIFLGYGSATTGATGKIRRFDTTGTVLNTYSLVSGNLVYLNHFVLDRDGISFWVWGWNTSSSQVYAIFRKILIADGSTLTEFNVPVFTNTSGNLNQINKSFGISPTSGFLSLSLDVLYSGLYTLVSEKTNDTVYKSGSPFVLAIPNPFVEFAPINGDNINGG